MRIYFRLFMLFAIGWAAIAISGCNQSQKSISIAAAANTQFLMEDLTAAFKAESGIEATVSTASSGQLAAQIISGAPFDFFLSADMRYPDSLKAKGVVEKGPLPYAIGKLVIWTLKDISLDDALSALTRTDVTKVGIANPDLAPYGRAAQEALEKTGFYPYVKAKLIFGESISQVNQYITSGHVDLGFTALSSLVAGPMQGKGRFKEINPSFHTPITQGMVMLKAKEKNNEAAREQFWTFLQSHAARAIIERHGYALPK